MAKHGFDLGDYLRAADSRPYGETGEVTEQGTREQIEYIDLDRIDPDPENFYSLDGLDELAVNIELVGLQQPLRVRENPSAADGGTSPSRGGRRYTVVSGHRRRAACLMIRDGGNRMFEGGVPCIVERGDVSKEMRELRLIYANAATRVMTSAELSKQAARVEELLYELKKQGVEFPGRMRDHVAAAVNASKTKLARLHAIRERLVPPLLKMFDAGEINEAVAYRLSQEDPKVQTKILEDQGAVLGHLTADGISSYVAQLRFMQNRKTEPVGAAISRPQKADDGRSRTPAPTEDDEAADENDEAPAENVGRQIAAPTEIRPTWLSGTPPRDGRYLCRVDMDLVKPHEQQCEYRSGKWFCYGQAMDKVGTVVSWWPLPDRG